MSHPRTPTPFRLAATALGALVVAGSFALVGPAGAGDTAAEREKVRRQKAAVAAQLDTLKATDAQVEAALATLNANVDAQTAAARSAERKAAAAEAHLTEVRAEVEAKRAEIAALNKAVRDLAVEAYVNPGDDDVITTLQSHNIGEAEVKRTLLDAKSSNQIDVLDQLQRAREDLEAAEVEADAAAQAAESRRAAAATKLSELRTARSQQAQLAESVQSRLDRTLAEAQALASLDSKLSKQLAAEQARLAAQLRASSSSSGAVRRTGGSVGIVGSGSIVSVRGIRVHKSIASQLAAMLSAADADGITFGGGGYRDSSQQIALRRAHCGSSNYDVYEKSPSACSPPTARPGQSMHEKGLAIDFTYNGRVINSRSSPGYQWLRANAAGYGFYNLPSEPWHWSVNGQ